MQRFHAIDTRSVLDRLLEYCRAEMDKAAMLVMNGPVPPPPETAERIARYKTLAGVLDHYRELTKDKEG